MDFGLTGKTALVAASSRGLGRAVAEELAGEGCRLVMCSRSVDAIEAAADTIRERTGAEVVAVPADLTDPASVAAVVRAAVDRFGQVDVLVTNTGGPPAGPFEAHGPGDWTRAVNQNLDSVLNLTRAVLPGMKERRWGRIVNVTSIAVKQPVDGLILSNSVRAAVTGFAKTLANEVASFGVTVNNVMPGYTRTERLGELAAHISETKGIRVEDAFATWEASTPMARIGEPREFAAVVAFLCSERASYVTGVSIQVDGGAVKSLL
jgi:3-oxoacyl-[acyl-carrier protein] reductase